MQPGFNDLLDATIAHLEALRSSGARQVLVSSQVLAELSASTGRKAPTPTPSVPAPAAVRPASASPIAPTAPRPPSAPAALPASVTARWNTATQAPAPRTPPAPASVPAPIITRPPKLDPIALAAALENLRQRTVACVKCPNLVSSRKNVVFGVGDPQARLMFVGEAPGADEDAQGEPFVGLAGELLTKIITAMGLSRSQVYIANILKCRPDTPGQPYGNRKPTPEEMTTCLPWLQEQIGLIQPQVMVALGVTAVEGLLGKTDGITRLRGKWQNYQGIPLMPTYHPAYLLRTQLTTDKRKVWEDMMSVMERLQMPISEKQRGYFVAK
ncbi:MAG: uracil-DNA glycosylase [Verrucomicrobia bacterium]|nr:uracil-DNA glycosylase [Verrucomicrobiota bacterium]